jgi:hypothetical protein
LLLLVFAAEVKPQDADLSGARYPEKYRFSTVATSEHRYPQPAASMDVLIEHGETVSN